MPFHLSSWTVMDLSGLLLVVTVLSNSTLEHLSSIWLHFNTRLNMWERSHKCNLHLGDLWTMLTIEWATLSSWRQMGSVKTKRIRQVGTQNLPYPLDPFDVLYAPAWISTLKGPAQHVSYCCCICLRRGHFSHLLAISLNKNCFRKVLAWKK